MYKKSKNSKGDFRAIATGHFFRMNMRSHHMSCLGMANPEDGKKKAHDMTVMLKSLALCITRWRSRHRAW